MLKKVLNRLQHSVKGLDDLDYEKDKNAGKKASKVAAAYNFFVEASVGHKKRTKELMELIKSSKIMEDKNKKKALGYLEIFRSYWQKTMISYSKDSFFDLWDWESQHKYSNETIREFFLNLIGFCNDNETRIENSHWYSLNLSEFQDYLNRVLVWEQEIIVSAEKGKRRKKNEI